MRRSQIVFALLLVAASASALAQSRELHWDRLAVKAHLDADGLLEVEETQVMVFTGDWNGGERSFNVRPRQELTFHGIARVDPATGAAIPMINGSLDRVDQWDWADRNVLRWRAREESDRPFDRTSITYVLRYALTNVLQRDGETFVLDHDFAFPDRAGPIHRFTLDLTLDPVWQPVGSLVQTWAAEGLKPGTSFVVTVPLRYGGDGSPVADGGIGKEVSMMLRALAFVPLLLLGYALTREKMLGRLDRTPYDRISRAWIEQNLLKERPEVIGAMWDGAVGSAEVSALLARMVGEGRLESNVTDGEMELRLLSREGLNEYERELIDGLFFDGGDYTTTEMIRQHYEDKGFNPAAAIELWINDVVEERLAKGSPASPSAIVPALFFIGAVAPAVYMVWRDLELLMPALIGGFCTLVIGGLMTAAPDYWRKRKSLGILSALAALLPAALVVGAIGFVIWRSAKYGYPELTFDVQLALAAAALWIFQTAVYMLQSRESREAIAFRKMLGAAREYFRRELRKEHPSLEDAWYPYIVAFGLDKDVARWFRSFPAASSAHSARPWSSGAHSGSASSASSPSGWTGGGGAFGGAGATGSWAIAASGMAAGVAAPSSSGGGSSGGGSSGGGGGGGW